MLQEDQGFRETKAQWGFLGGRVLQEKQACLSLGPVVHPDSLEQEVFLDSRVLLAWMANRVILDRRGRWVPQVPGDYPDPQDKKEKRVSVQSTPTGST